MEKKELTVAKIPEKYVQRLRSTGLFVSEPWPITHVFSDGVLVGKPVGVSGNSIPGYSSRYTNVGAGSVEFDASPVRLFSNGERWFVDAVDYAPGPGPGDFLDEWKSVDEAVNDILDFYFGDQRRMQAKAAARVEKVS